MATMTWYEGEYYSVYTRDGIPDALVGDFDEMTLEQCRALIDKRNAWAHGNAAAADVGCKPMQYAIVKHTWNRCFYQDGSFCEYNRKERMVELYPQDI